MNAMSAVNWSDDRVEQLKSLWTEGLSASQIARALGGVTRNAVIGKVHRLGLSGRAKSPSSSAPRPRKARSGGHMMRVPRSSMRGNSALAYDYEPEPEPELIEIPVGRVLKINWYMDVRHTKAVDACRLIRQCLLMGVKAEIDDVADAQCLDVCELCFGRLT